MSLGRGKGSTISQLVTNVLQEACENASCVRHGALAMHWRLTPVCRPLMGDSLFPGLDTVAATGPLLDPSIVGDNVQLCVAEALRHYRPHVSAGKLPRASANLTGVARDCLFRLQSVP